MKKFVDAMKHPAAPFAIFALLLAVDTILHNMQAFTLCSVVGVMLSVVMVISTLFNLKAYSKVLRGITIVLCAVTVLYSIVEVGQLGREESRRSVSASSSVSGNTSGNRSNSGYSSGNHSSSGSKTNSTSRTCHSCNGSKKCHVCSGKGSSACPGSSCRSGRCRECKGTGLYDHGSYVSRCIVCSGDGYCNICNGTGRRDCSICHGTGKCTQCR